MTDDVLLRVEHLSKKYCKDRRRALRYAVRDIASELNIWKNSGRAELRSGEFWALDDICLELRPGESLGIIGRNGAGKSTFLKLLTGLIKPDAGSITVRGRVGALIELGAGFNPVLSGRENIYVSAAVLGLQRRETDRIVDDVIEFSGIGDFIDSPVRNYSSGMWARLGYAVAAHLNPNLLIVDEVLAVGDLAFQRKCLRHMHSYLRAGGALIFVSHDPYTMQSACQRGILIEHGKAAFAGTAVETLDRYFRLLDLEERAGTGGNGRSARASELPHGPCEGNGEAAAGAPAQEHGGDGMPSSRPEAEPPPAGSTTDAAGRQPSPSPDHDNPIAIVAVEITPAEGEQIRTGRAARITVRYHAIREIALVFWAFAIYTSDHQVCVSGDVEGFTGGDCRASPGEGVFCCTLPNLPLIAGSYVLKAVVGDPLTGAQYDRWGWENPPTTFEVRDEITTVSNLYAIAGCLVKLDVEWDAKRPRCERETT